MMIAAFLVALGNVAVNRQFHDPQFAGPEALQDPSPPRLFNPFTDLVFESITELPHSTVSCLGMGEHVDSSE